MKYITALLVLLAAACNTKKQAPAKNTADAVSVQQPEQKAAAEPIHADDGKPWFDFTFSRNGIIQIRVESDKPVFIPDENSITVILDSSHHILTNGDMLNLYIAGKTAKEYPVSGQSNVKDAASMILTFAKPSAELPLFSPQQGKIIITQLDANSCSGKFESSGKEHNGDVYVLKGTFLHARLTY